MSQLGVVSHLNTSPSILPAAAGEIGKVRFVLRALAMLRLIGLSIIFSLTLASSAIAQSNATSASAGGEEAAQRTEGQGQPASAASTASDLCNRLEQAAAENGLPFDFFVRLIWQESRFDGQAVSPKGAQGIAQFMPKTAESRGLGNPFDVGPALKASASYLQDLRVRFGNLGLAAAAYNAGPQRLQDWLSARVELPTETRHYVKIVTGHSADEWIGGTTRANLELPEPLPCTDVTKIGLRTAMKSNSGTEKVLASGSLQAKLGWGIQLIGSPSQASALASFQQMQKAYKKLLMTRHPLVIQSKVGTNGSWYRVRVATDSRDEAEKLCSDLRAAGGSCLVQRN
jgi:Transglycosylase SLT domain/SPOR domain